MASCTSRQVPGIVTRYRKRYGNEYEGHRMMNEWHAGSRGPAHYIGGEWLPPATGRAIDVLAPASGERIAEVAAGDAADIDLAVAAATDAMHRTALGRWSPAARQDALLALADAIDDHAEEFARIEMSDAGKPIRNVRMVDVPQAAAGLRYFAGWATKLSGETMSLSVPGNWHACTLREPVGVAGQIIPWNYPLMGAAMKIGPALAAGCAVVIKPSEHTSLSILRLADFFESCGFPAGMINVVTGYGDEAGAALVDHAGVAKIAFTGSTVTGQHILRTAAPGMKRVTVELGGKSPVVVLPDADLDAAARAIGMGIFFNSGQTCSAGSRLLVHASVADELAAKVTTIAQAMLLGDPSDEATTIGPVISEAQRDRVMGFVERGIGAGARCLVGGQRPGGAGYYVQPTVLTDVGPDMEIAREEVFGPVLAVQRFETLDLDEIAALANDNAYGLSAYVWTRDIGHAFGLVQRIKAGTVRVNTASGSDFAMPAGGVKHSGNGRENGRLGVEAYTEIKTVTVAI